MSKNDNLLTEGQVRQFMKLANLEPLTPGFVHGLHEGGKEDEASSKGVLAIAKEKDAKPPKSGLEKDAEKALADSADEVEEGLGDAWKWAKRKGKEALSGVSHGGGIKGDPRAANKAAADAAERRQIDTDAYAHQAKNRDPETGEEIELGTHVAKGGRVKGISGRQDKKAEPALAGKARQQESHGRGRGEGAAGYGHPDDAGRAGARLREDSEYDEHELENAEDDLEHADDLDIDAEEDLGDVGLDMGPDEGGREVSVDDFLVALEQALESVLGDEVEVEQDEEEDEEIELPLEGGEELDVGVEEEPPLQEMINTITKRVAKRIVREALQNKK